MLVKDYLGRSEGPGRKLTFLCPFPGLAGSKAGQAGVIADFSSVIRERERKPHRQWTKPAKFLIP